MSDVTSGGEYRRTAQEQEHDQAQPRVVPLGESQGHGREPGPAREPARGQGQGLGQGLGSQSPVAAGHAGPAVEPSTGPALEPSADPVTDGRDRRAAATGGAPAGAVEDGTGHDTSRSTGAAPSTGTSRSTGAAPVTRDADGTSLLPHDECDKLSERMRHAVAGFVDRPRDAVEEADQVLEELAARFTDAVNSRRRTLRGSWQLADGKKGEVAGTADTEQLRLALRDYRELTDRLIHL
ncbi:hypothetical protein [Streptomyces sp. NPDC003401]